MFTPPSSVSPFWWTAYRPSCTPKPSSRQRLNPGTEGRGAWRAPPMMHPRPWKRKDHRTSCVPYHCRHNDGTCLRRGGRNYSYCVMLSCFILSRDVQQGFQPLRRRSFSDPIFSVCGQLAIPFGTIQTLLPQPFILRVRWASLYVVDCLLPKNKQNITGFSEWRLRPIKTHYISPCPLRWLTIRAQHPFAAASGRTPACIWSVALHPLPPRPRSPRSIPFSSYPSHLQKIMMSEELLLRDLESFDIPSLSAYLFCTI